MMRWKNELVFWLAVAVGLCLFQLAWYWLNGLAWFAEGS